MRSAHLYVCMYLCVYLCVHMLTMDYWFGVLVVGRGVLRVCGVGIPESCVRAFVTEASREIR